MTTSKVTPPTAAADQTGARRLPGGRTVRLLARNRLALAGGVISLIFLLIGIVGLMIISFDRFHDLYLNQDLQNTLRAPMESGKILGTDLLGRDLLARTVSGIGVSMALAVGITAITIVVGLTIGIVAAYYGGLIDLLFSGVIDITWGFPIILMAIALTGVLDRGIEVVLIAVPLVLWAGFARIVRGEVLSLRERDFITAAKAMGIPDRRIMLRHLVPNLASPIVVMATYYIPVVIVFEGALSFLGFGTQPPTPSLGLMISDGRQLLQTHHWAVTIPGVALMMMVIGFNTFGDGLRDVLDPRMSRVR